MITRWSPKLSKATRIVAVMQNGGQGLPWIAFAGSGTTLQVAARLRRDYIGIELKPEYAKMANLRAMQGEIGISTKEQKVGQMALFSKDA